MIIDRFNYKLPKLLAKETNQISSKLIQLGLIL